jgi:hypothetical protein
MLEAKSHGFRKNTLQGFKYDLQSHNFPTTMNYAI